MLTLCPHISCKPKVGRIYWKMHIPSSIEPWTLDLAATLPVITSNQSELNRNFHKSAIYISGYIYIDISAPIFMQEFPFHLLISFFIRLHSGCLVKNRLLMETNVTNDKMYKFSGISNIICHLLQIEEIPPHLLCHPQSLALPCHSDVYLSNTIYHS